MLTETRYVADPASFLIFSLALKQIKMLFCEHYSHICHRRFDQKIESLYNTRVLLALLGVLMDSVEQ